MPPSDPSPEKLVASFARQDWPRLRLQLLRFALYRTRSRPAAEDAVQEALRRGLDENHSPWDPDREPDLARHLMRVMDNVLRVQSKNERVRSAPRNLAKLEERTPQATPEDEALERETDAQALRLLEKIEERFTDDWLARAVIGALRSGIDEPAAQAAALDQPIEEIRKARNRLRYAYDVVVAAERAATAGEETAP